MHIHYFQHDHFEDLGYMGDWANLNNITTSVSRFDISPEFPPFESYDWLVVLGGKMGVNDSSEYLWIAAEISYIRDAIRSGKTVIGICLGSQFIASALDARIYKNQEPEMGFFPVRFNDNAQNDSVFHHFPKELIVMHMHFDTFDIPRGAIPMAESEITKCQAFRYGNKVFALQFHFEITESNAPDFVREITPELVPGRMVQQPGEMLQHVETCSLNNQVFAKMLDSILLNNSVK
jgi:GMP synthase-like glutamine amidotransferase